MLVKTLLKRNGLTENEALLGLVGWLSVHLLSLYMYNCSVFFVFFSVILLFFRLGIFADWNCCCGTHEERDTASHGSVFISDFMDVLMNQPLDV